jgi:putative endonuclease
MRSWTSSSSSDYGRRAETVACWWLRLRGYSILARNVRVLGREVDVVARRGRTLVVCEVKARRRGVRGLPEEMVGEAQRRRLLQAAEVLLAADPRARTARVDVVAVTGLRPRHIRAALS